MGSSFPDGIKADEPPQLLAPQVRDQVAIGCFWHASQESTEEATEQPKGRHHIRPSNDPLNSLGEEEEGIVANYVGPSSVLDPVAPLARY